MSRPRPLVGSGSRHAGWLAGVLACSLSAPGVACGGPETVPDAAVATPAWRAPGELSLRRDPAGGGLLLRHSASDRVYRVLGDSVGAANGADAVDLAAWERAATSVARCAEQSAPAKDRMWIEPHGQTLTAGGEPVDLAAPLALVLGLSPSGERVAVLTAAGPARRSLLPFLGGGGAEGPRFHQLLRTADAARLGEPVPVAVAATSGPIAVCWSADERFVVYHDANFTHLSIVTIPESAEAPSEGEDR